MFIYTEVVYIRLEIEKGVRVVVINLTDVAKEQLKEILESKETDKMLRVYVAGYG